MLTIIYLFLMLYIFHVYNEGLSKLVQARRILTCQFGFQLTNLTDISVVLLSSYSQILKQNLKQGYDCLRTSHKTVLLQVTVF
jgi:hypothetical protein